MPKISMVALSIFAVLSTASFSNAPLSVLPIIPHLREATEEFLAHKKALKLKGRRLDADADEDFTNIGEDNDDEEIIDPNEDMPDNRWDDDEDGFYDTIENDDSPCVAGLMDITNNFMSYNDTVMHIFRNSGKDYNDFGRYEDCQ